MKVEVDQILHMVGGLGETSYATNSTLQEKAIFGAKTVVQRSINEVYCTLKPETLIAADLGCSSGPTTFMVISEVMDAVHEICYDESDKLPELMFFLNDLPGNDFNTIFKSLPGFEKKVREKIGMEDVPFYVVGAPGSFYRRLFPEESVHFVHSSHSLHWLSQVRSKEIIPGGQMVVTILGRSNLNPSSGEVNYPFGLLSEALNSLVEEGILEEERVDAFDMPFYAPAMEEVKAVVENEGSFELQHFEAFELNMDPSDDCMNDFVADHTVSGEIFAKMFRAVMEPMLVSHFGDSITIMDSLFSRYAQNVAKHLKEQKTKLVNFTLALKIKGK